MPIAVSLFSGGGGCSLGFRQAGFDIIYASDINNQAVNTYKKNFPNTLCEKQNIAHTDFIALLKRFRLRVGEVDIIIGGPPCQGFSTAGMRFWDDPRNKLLKHYVRALNIIKPKWFLMENVEGLLTANKGTYLYEVTNAFIELGYRIRVDKVYAQEYGIPQRRKRVLIIGNRIGADFELPPIKHYASGAIFRKAGLTILEAIQGLPQPASNLGESIEYQIPPNSEWEKFIRGTAISVKDHFVPVLSDIQLARIKALGQGQTMKDLPRDLQHASFTRRAQRRVMDGTPTEKRGGAPSGLKRLFGDEPSLTITGAAIRELIHPSEDRPLTLRECARLQTFPDSFDFQGTAMQKIQQIGNAIPPLLAKIFAEHIRQNYGFKTAFTSDAGELLGFTLTKADAMSPALERTHQKLISLQRSYVQPSLFG
jgi:DNA (cytosine-5)-methyltransferase 1